MNETRRVKESRERTGRKVLRLWLQEGVKEKLQSLADEYDRSITALLTDPTESRLQLSR